MTDYVELRTSQGDAVAFEVDADDGPVPAGRRWQQSVERAGETLEQSLGRIRQLLQLVATELAEPPNAPDRLTVEVGLKAGVEANLAVAKSATEAHIKVVVEWDRSGLGEDVAQAAAGAADAGA